MKKFGLIIIYFSSLVIHTGVLAQTSEGLSKDGGLEVKITHIHGYRIGHDPSYPADGIGTTNYLTAVCQSLGYDDFVWDINREWVEKAKYAYFDMSLYQWRKNRGPGLIYKYIVCRVYLAS